MKHLALLISTVVLFGSDLAAQRITRVLAEAGDLYAESDRGIRRKLTSGAIYYDPVLAPDGRTVYFCRGGSAVRDRTLWKLDAQATLLRETPVLTKRLLFRDWPCTGCRGPVVTEDSRFLFLDMWFSDTSGILARVDLQTGASRLLGPATSFHLIKDKGIYLDHLVVRIRKPLYFGFSYWAYLWDVDGKEIMVIGDDWSVASFRDSEAPGLPPNF